MSEVLRTVILDGELGRRFGRSHKLVVNSPAEALRALCCVIDGLQQAVVDYKPGFHVFVNNDALSADDQLHHPSGSAEIRITPVIAAAGGGVFNVFLGVALIGAAFFTGGASLAAWGMASIAMGGLGATLLFMGAGQMFMPKQKGLDGVESVENKASYHFNGPANITAQGNAVPVLYGDMWCGSVVVSTGLYNEDIEA